MWLDKSAPHTTARWVSRRQARAREELRASAVVGVAARRILRLFKALRASKQIARKRCALVDGVADELAA